MLFRSPAPLCSESHLSTGTWCLTPEVWHLTAAVASGHMQVHLFLIATSWLFALKSFVFKYLLAFTAFQEFPSSGEEGWPEAGVVSTRLFHDDTTP